MSSDCCCVLFTKPGRPGEVKTRLIGKLTAGQAAELHTAFLEDLVTRLSKGSFDLRIAWAVGESEVLPESRVPGYRQSGRDLGERLCEGLRRAAGDHSFVAAIGSDHPEIPLDRVERAFESLARGTDLAIGPASDGGYYLIALRRGAIDRRLFENISWSSPSVFEQTLSVAHELGLIVDRLPTGDDVDSPDDLDRLVHFLATDPAGCERTVTLLRSWGRLS